MMRTLLIGLALLGAVLTAGCGNRDRSNPNASATAPVTTGTVGQLTGDADDEVTPELQQLVEDALARGEDDEPLEIQ